MGTNTTNRSHPKLSNREKQHKLTHSPGYQPYKRTETQREALSKVLVPALEIRGRSPGTERSPLLCITKRKFGIYMYTY
jgi:hypothetical protein